MVETRVIEGNWCTSTSDMFFLHFFFFISGFSYIHRSCMPFFFNPKIMPCIKPIKLNPTKDSRGIIIPSKEEPKKKKKDKHNKPCLCTSNEEVQVKHARQS